MSTKAAKLRREAREKRLKELEIEADIKVQKRKDRASTPYELLTEEQQFEDMLDKAFPKTDKQLRDFHINEGIKKFDQEYPIVVSGSYADEKMLANTYKQKFVELTRACNPRVLPELNSLLPLFRQVFGKKQSYARIFDWHLVANLVDVDYHLNTDISSAVREWFQKGGIEGVRIDDREIHKEHDPSNKWGNFRLLLDLTFLAVLRSQDREFARQFSRTTPSIRNSFSLPELTSSGPQVERGLEIISETVVMTILAREF